MGIFSMRYGPFAAQDFATISTLGLEFAVAVALGVAAGYWVDRSQGWAPWGMVVGALGGFALGMYIVVKEAKRLEKTNTQDKR